MPRLRRGHSIRAALVAAIVALGAAAAPATAGAAVVGVVGTSAVFAAQDGEDNYLHISYGTDSFGDYVKFDDDVNITVQPGDLHCANDGPKAVLCDRQPNTLADLGDMDDRGVGGNLDEVIDGGPGNDKLLGNEGNDTLIGSGGNDQFERFAFFGTNLSGDIPIRGNDEIQGGDGTDTV